MKTSAAFLMGAFLGACATVFLTRARNADSDRDDPNGLYGRMDQRIQELEARTRELRLQKEAKG